MSDADKAPAEIDDNPTPVSEAAAEPAASDAAEETPVAADSDASADAAAVSDDESVPAAEEPAPVSTPVSTPEPTPEPPPAPKAPERVYTQSEVDVMLAAAESDKYLRTLAEFDNYRRRTAREKEQWEAEAIRSFLSDLLPVIDSFDLARGQTEGAPDAVIEGLDITHRQLMGALQKNDVERLDPVGEPFDPRFHEALMRQPSADVAPGSVATVFEKGYTISGRLVRAARVVVATEPPQTAEPAADSPGETADEAEE